MRERFLNQTAITGYGFLLLTLLPYFQEGAKMSPTAWVLVGIGAVLVLYGTLNPPKRRSYYDVHAIVMERNRYLPDIKDGITEYLERAELLANKRELYDLEVYRNELGIHDKAWGWVKKLINVIEKKDKENALWLQIHNNFMIDNVILARIKQDDASEEGNLRLIKTRLDGNVSKVHDKKLTRYIKRVYMAEHVAQSYAVFAKVSRDKFHLELSDRRVFVRQEQGVRESLHKAIGNVNAYIDFLSGGRDLWTTQ